MATMPGQFTPRRDKTWRRKFLVALRGWKFGVRGHSSFFVHFFAAVAVICAAIVLEVNPLAWALLALCIGLVLTTELFNSALEVLHRGQEQATRERTWPALDIAAGAVLCASVTAAVAGTIIFVRRLVELYG